jgi:amino acid permease
MNKKIKFLIDLFIIIASLYIWYIFITYTTFLDVFITSLRKNIWFFISSIIIVILLIFIDRKSSMKGKK